MTESRIDDAAPILVPEPAAEVPAVVPEVEKQITMSQSQLDALIKSRQSASLKKAAAAEAEVTRLRAIAVGSSADATEIEKLRAAVADGALRAEAAERQSTAQSKAVLQARLAQTIDSIDGDSTTKLLRDNLVWNGTDKRFDVLDDNQVVREDITPEMLYSEFAQTHPWSIRGRTLSGGGGASSIAHPITIPDDNNLARIFGKGSDSSFANALCLRDPRKYAQLKVQAQRAGLI